MTFTPRKEQFTGCLIGLCLGDAVGFPVEGYPTLICQRYMEQVLMAENSTPWTHYPFPFGQYSDDSQLSRELLLSYLQCHRLDPEDYAHRLAVIYQNKKLIGYGRATASAAEQLIRGIPWTYSGVLPPSAGNGSAVRAAPLGLLYYDNPDLLFSSATDQSRITHQDSRCSAGAVAIAKAVALLLQTKELVVEDFLQQISNLIKLYSEPFADFLVNLNFCLTLPRQDALVVIAKAGMEEGEDNGWQGISPFVISSVLWSFYSFLTSPRDYWQTICTAVGVGGDADTTAAMAGALSGAFLGIEGIPDKPARLLTDQGTWNYTQLVHLAEQCFELKMNMPAANKL
jgi:ADP-ribosylglycohydrolase